MSSSHSSETLHDELRQRLAPHGTEGVRSALKGVIDLDAVADRQYNSLVSTLDARLTQAWWSVLSMLLAGIYFGVVVGHWLFDLSSPSAIATWGIPTGLVSIYALYAGHQTLALMRELAEARALARVLDDRERSTEV